MSCFHEVFHTGILPEGLTREELVAIGLCGWTMCSMQEPPKNFGKGMAAIGEALGTGASLKILNQLADQIRSEESQKN